MLPLVVADRHEVGLVEQDVARHQDRVGEEPGRDELLALALVLELRHPAELPVARDRREEPRRLRVRRHVALREHRRPLRVEPGREEQRRQVERPLAQVGRVVVDGDRVEVDDAEERLAARLDRPRLRLPRTAGSRPTSCRSASRPLAGCRRRCASSFELSQPLASRPYTCDVAVVDSTWSPSSWRELEALQQPAWPDAARRSSASSGGSTRIPPLVFAGEARQVRAGARRRSPTGRAFLLQAGDCAESFHDFERLTETGAAYSAVAIRAAAADPAPDGGRAHLRRRGAGAQGRAGSRGSS